VILDTNALSAVADGDTAAVEILAKADQVAVPVIVLGEYRYGIAQSRNQKAYANWLKALINDCMVLDVNETTTLYYAEITLELKRNGKPIPTNDIWIAALCRQHALPLLSRDRHFDLVAGTTRISW
jgi:predicted nucleic acid-binding protein